MFIKVIDGKAVDYTVAKLKSDNKNTSFPKKPDNQLLASFGVYPAVMGDQPSFNNATHGASLNDTATKIDGVWTYGWTITKYTDSELAAGQVALAEDMRTIRNEKIAESDWMALADVTMADNWKTYRQALRDLPTHSDWPNLKDSDWPTKPGT